VPLFLRILRVERGRLFINRKFDFMKEVIIKDIERKTTIPKSVIRKAVEKVYGVKLDAPKKLTKKLNKKAA
jgi:hypothetical protein